ncbi:MAG TPA: hypothetical protein VH280_12210 [Verrucomicrobiae bacterium]|nr:hypothetical protein [Verrucomicrobiae bacterium]
MSRQNHQKSVATPSPSLGRSVGYAFPVLLFAILAVLFAKSFLPGYVHFSNDGPLGEQNAARSQMPGILTGVWDDLNDIGTAGGAAAPDVSAFAGWILTPVGDAKFAVPLTLFLLGMSAWVFFRQLRFSPLASALGSLATALNSSYVGNACWGTFPQQIAVAMIFLSLALVMANSDETRPLIRWSRIALAGLAVGVSVMEGADNGAIFSLFVAAFIFFKSLVEDAAPVVTKVGRGIGRVAVVAIFAALIAAQTITSLVGAFIVGTAGMDQSKGTETSLQHWDWATQWSLPKKETIAVFVPGVFGYRMDTPKDMMDFLQKDYVGGEYWGGMGRTPEIDRFFDSGKSGPPPSGPGDWMRFGYAGFYCGIFVALVAFFGIAQSFRGGNSIFPSAHRHLIWFWTAVLVITLLLSWGRFAPFYHFFYLLPYFSTIRNPAKFMAIFYMAIIIIFAYGMDGLSRRHLNVPAGKLTSSFAQLKNWWSGVRGFDRNWTMCSLGIFALSVLGWVVYAGQKPALIRYLGKVGFSDPDGASQIATFSIGQVGWFLVYFAAAVILVILVLSGVFSGKRARLGGVLMGVLLVADLGRANLPWIIHWNYNQKYESNAIIDMLRDKPYEHRVADLQSDSPFEQLYRIEWMQHHFPYYNVQCLDIIQSPRVTSDLAAYDIALAPTQSSLYHLARKWELSNTRYLLGPAGYLDSINQQLDPVQHRFRILKRFTIVPKPGIENPTELEQLTVVPDTNGDYALFEFGGALPRAKLYANWQVSTNANATLETLASQDFDPQKTVLVSTPLPDPPANPALDANPGTVEFKSYTPNDIVLTAQAKAPSVLLFNDKFDPNWRVQVDGKPADLLHCNFIMRGVFVSPGAHTVEFKFSLPHKPLYITIAAIVIGFILGGFLFFATQAGANRNRLGTSGPNQ